MLQHSKEESHKEERAWEKDQAREGKEMVGRAHRVVLEVQKNLRKGDSEERGNRDLDGTGVNGFSFLEKVGRVQGK